MSKIYRNLIQLHRKVSKNPIFTMSKGPEYTFFKENIQMTNSYMKKVSNTTNHQEVANQSSKLMSSHT